MRRRRESSIHSKSHSRSTSKSPPKSNYYRNRRVNNSPPKPQSIPTLLDKIYKVYSFHTRYGELFIISFSFLRPQNGLDNLNSIPDLVNFRFQFWDFGEFYTVPGVLKKPEEYKVNHLLTSPVLPIVKYNMIDYYTQDNHQEVLIEIKYDPSINNFINYKSFLSYLVFRELFIEIYDYDKQMPYGYAKVPLSKFLRDSGAKFSNGQIEVNIFDNFTHEPKGSLGLTLKSEEFMTQNPFNIIEQNDSLNLIDMGNINNKKDIKKKKVVSVATSSKKQLATFDSIKNEEEKNYYKNIDKIKLSVIKNKTTIFQSNNKHKNNDDAFNYNEKKEAKIQSTLIDFNKKNNELTISLIQGEPHYFNYIIHNETDTKQNFHVVISTDGNKYTNNYKDDIILSLVTNSEEYEYVTMIKNLKIPYNYHTISENGYFNLEPQKAMPLLFKCLCYKSFNGLEENFQIIHSIIIYDDKGMAKYYAKVKILKVFPIIDWEFYYKNPKGQNKKAYFINPFKNMTYEKSKQLLKNYVFLNGIDHKNFIPEIKMDQKTNDFYFIYNNNLDFVNNAQSSSNPYDIQSFYYKTYSVQKTVDKYNNKKLLFLYKDKFGSQLLVTYKFIINEYEYLNVSYNLGARMKKALSFSYFGNVNKKVKFCSNDSNLVFFDEAYNNGIEIEPNKMYQVEYYIYINKLKNYEIMVNCIDTKNKEIFKSWVVYATPGKLNIIKKMDINYIIEVSNDVRTSFEFTNPLKSYSIINFICSTKTVIEIPIYQINFEPNETKNIIVNIRKILIPQKITAYIFIMDEYNLFHDVVQIDIDYH